MSKEFPAKEANPLVQERNDAVRGTSDSSLFAELRADLNALAEIQRKPFRRFLMSLFGSRNRTKQQLTGLELIRLLEMAGLKPPDKINPDRMIWVSYRRFRNLMAKAEVRRAEWERE